MSIKTLIELLVDEEFQQLAESLDGADVKHAADYIEWLKNLKSKQNRPTGWRVGRLKKERVGKSCAFCGEKTLVGVEHIILRSLGGPKFDRWNLAWSCYPCNDARGSGLGLPNRDVPMIGWLGVALGRRDLPSEKDIIEYFRNQPIKKRRFNNIVKEVIDGSEINDPLYHVTYFNRLGGISEAGLRPGMARSIGAGGYDAHSKKGVFLTEDDGVSFWFNRAEQFAEHNSDNPLEDGLVPVVLKIDPAAFLEDDLFDDELGSKDAVAGAYIIPDGIDADYIDVWDGTNWIPVDEWDSIDIEQSFDKEEIEDEDGDDDAYFMFKYDNPLLP